MQEKDRDAWGNNAELKHKTILLIYYNIVCPKLLRIYIKGRRSRIQSVHCLISL